MTPALAAARPGGNLHRVGRGADAWAWPAWAYAGEDGTFGNRFDDPAGEYRVRYASSPRLEPHDERSEEIARDDSDLLAALRTLDLVMAEPSAA